MIGMKHGAGGRAMRALIESTFLDTSSNGPAGGVGPHALDDGAAIPFGDRWLVLTTDSHVVKPLFFPGGDIGRLAISGTVNDLAVMGATEVLGLTSSFIIEEGLPVEVLQRVQASMHAASREASAPVLTGDTKVMGHGEVDGLVINTAGVAVTDRVVTDAGLRPSDALIVSGTIGDHGLAILAVREGIELERALSSDVAPVGTLVRAALDAGGGSVTAMKDPTRGGLASALTEMADKAGVGVLLDGPTLPTSEAVRGASEVFGIDPLHVANEGKVVFGVRPEAAESVLAALRDQPMGSQAAIIGRAIEGHAGSVILETGFGRRLVCEPEGEPLPRIC